MSATLAIDTSAGTSVAIVTADGRAFEHESQDPMRHAEAIGDLLAAVIGDADVAPGGVSRVVAGMGPGPFTGLRVGIAAARAFAFAADAELIPVVSHDAPAWDAWSRGDRGPLVVVTDARRREVYWTQYLLLDGGVGRVDSPTIGVRDGLDLAVGPRIEHPRVSALALIRRADRLIEHGHPLSQDRPLYLRAPDVTPSAGPKRVSR